MLLAAICAFHEKDRYNNIYIKHKHKKLFNVDIKKIILNKMATILELAAIALFVCITLIWIPHHCWWRAANYDHCSAHLAIEQWGFFSLPHLLWHGASVYNGRLQRSMTLTPISERLAVKLSLHVFFDLGLFGVISKNFK